MKIGVFTTNDHKFSEMRSDLELYGVESVQVKTREELDFTRYKYLLVEQSKLSGPLEHLNLVEHQSTLHVYKDRDIIPSETYKSVTEGYIDLTRFKPEDSFGWDWCFIQHGKSNYENAQLGRKVSARQKNMSQFASEVLKLKRQQCFNHLENHGSVVSFDKLPSSMLEDETFAACLDASPPLLRKLVHHALNKGQFFRSAMNRRQRNYWFAGLNSGIPTTPKKDKLHELTYFIHDLFHQLWPDPVMTAYAPRTYTFQRMMSEAFTLVLGDQLFVDSFKTVHPQYDTSKRCIYPLYDSLRDKDPYAVLRANAYLMLLGDDSKYLDLGASPTAIAQARGKYESFFVRDFEWTWHNAKSMRTNLNTNADWVGVFYDFIPLSKVDTDFDHFESYQRLLEYTYAPLARSVVEIDLKPLEELVPVEVQRERAFKKWLAGQAMYFVREGNTEIARMLKHDCSDIERVRAFVDHCMRKDMESGKITSQDYETYTACYPMYTPHYVFYDRKLDRPLSEILEEIWLG